MQLLQVIGLFAGIAILIIGAYRGVGALPITVLAGFVVVITNGMPIWESFSGDYMDGYINFLKSYFPILPLPPSIPSSWRRAALLWPWDIS